MKDTNNNDRTPITTTKYDSTKKYYSLIPHNHIKLILRLSFLLLQLGKKDTVAYIINGIMLAISFGLARVVLWFAMIKAYAIYRDVTFYDALFLLPKVCICFSTIFFSMNLFWFCRILFIFQRSIRKIITKKMKS